MIKVNPWIDRIFKIIAIVSFSFILVLLTIISRIGPASSYEFSIYDAYPWYFWLFFLLAVLCGQVIIFRSAIARSRNIHWLFGLCAILILNAILLFMPLIRGYFSYDEGDVLTHIGYMQDILNSASIGANHYPIDHILGIGLHFICGLSLPDITLIIPPFFSFFFIFSMYILGKTIFKNKFEFLIFMLGSSILLFMNYQYTFTPNSQALLLLPLLIFLSLKIYYGGSFRKYNILLLLLSFLVVFYHPLVTVILIIILCLMQLMLYILERDERKPLKKENYIYNIVFIIAIFSIWSSYLAMAAQVVEPIMNRIFGSSTTGSELQQKMNLLSQVHVDPLYLVKLILNVYGNWILLGLLSIFCISLIIKSIKNHQTKLVFHTGVLIMGFPVFVLLSIALFFYNGQFGFARMYTDAIIFSLMLIPTGIFIFLFNNSTNRSRYFIIKFLGIIFILFCITNFSIFNLYYSPIIKQANQQVPKSDYIGMNTFFSYRNESIPLFELGPVAYRFDHAIHGRSTSQLHVFSDDPKVVPPNHFGYENDTLLHIFYNNSKYLLLNDRGRGYNVRVNPEFEYRWSFSPKDFERIKSDDKYQKTYSNKNLEIFMIT